MGIPKQSSAYPAPARPISTTLQTSWRWVSILLRYGLVVMLSISFFLPLFWMFTSALKDNPQVYHVPPVWIPKPAYWDNFVNVWFEYDFTRYAINSVFLYALPVSLLSTTASCVVAYGFSRLRWPGRNILFFICLCSMMIPFQVTMVPLYIVFRSLGWLNSYRPLVVPSLGGSAFHIFLLRQFFMTIPEELSDSARIDGADELTIMVRIILPLARPALVVVALFMWMGAWNDYLGPLLYVNERELYPLALGIHALAGILHGQGFTERGYPYVMAVSTVATLPIIIGFFYTQRTFIEGISLTGLKG